MKRIDQPRSGIQQRWIALVAVLATVTADAASLPPNFAEIQVASGINIPTAMDVARDGRVFISERGGGVRVVKDGALLETNFFTAQVSEASEQGLTGLALDPGFATNGYVYLHYVPAGSMNTVLARLTASSTNPDVADPASLVILFNGPAYPPGLAIGGGIGFTPDGKLLLAVDAVFVNPTNSQQLTSLHGKLLRLNADGSIPSDNPFFNTATGDHRAIYAYGLRNPYTFAVQPNTGRIFANDVGDNRFEEVNEIVPGGNYGWPDFEGPSQPPALSPLWSYPHGQGTNAGFAVIGGTFYNPPLPQFPPEFVGTYFVADWLNAWVNVIDLNNSNTVFNFRTPDSPLAPVALKTAPDGSLYLLAQGNINFVPNSGVLLRITYGPPIEVWRLIHFGTRENSGPGEENADPDGDGILNIVEYGSRLDPNNASRAGLPKGAIAKHEDVDYLTLTFTRNAEAVDLTYTVETSGDLKAWTQVATSQAGAPTSGDGVVSESGSGLSRTVVVRDLVPVVVAETRFIRLTITH